MTRASEAIDATPIEVEGRYFDGVSARAHPVALRLDDRFRVSGPGVAQDWNLLDLRAAVSVPPLMRIGPAGEPVRVEFSDATLAAALAARCPDLHRRERSGGTVRLVLWSLAAGLSVLLVAVFGVPQIAGLLAPLVPDAAESRLGAVAEPQVLRFLYAAGIAADRTDPAPQEGLPLGRDAGRQGQGRRPGIAAGADILLGVAALPTPGEDPEPRDRPKLELGDAGARRVADLIPLSAHILSERHRDGTAAPTARARDGCQPHDRVAAPARSAHRTGPDRRGAVVAGGRGIDIDQGQVRSVSTGRRDDIRRDDVGSTIAAAGGGHHLGPRSLQGARRQVEDQDQAGAGRDDEPSAIADLPVAAWDTELTWPVTHQERVSLRRCLKKKSGPSRLRAPSDRPHEVLNAFLLHG
ncbi:DUF7092 domain-containing protein [Methylobacterium oryzae]|uniref:DUF7092 domain-containing protein n=1 Tax=Methylobacterium oryzae TaxID=334852 RepID=UPI003AF99ACF